MQDSNKEIIKTVLKNLATHTNVKGVRGLASYLGAKESKLYSWINRGVIGDKELLLAKIPNLNRDYLDTGEGEMILSYQPPPGDSIEFNFGTSKDSDLVSITYIEENYASAGKGVINFDTAKEVMHFDREFLLRQLGPANFKDVHIIHAIGDSMTPSISPGDLLFVNPGDKDIITGAVYVFVIGEETLVKRAERNPLSGELTLRSDNASYAPINIQGDDLDKVVVVGRVIGNFKKF